MNINKDHYITPDEYDKLQLTYNCKTEYVNGEILLSSNALDKHNDIIVNISSKIRNYLKGSECNVRTQGMEVYSVKMKSIN